MLVSVAVEGFKKDLSITRSAATVQAYSTALNHLARAVGDLDTKDVTANVVPDFVRWLHENNPVAQATLNLYLVALTRFYEWLVLADETPQDLLRFKKWISQYSKKKSKRAPKLPNEENVQRLMLFIRSDRPAPFQPETEAVRNVILSYLRNLALLETLRSTGCRIEEAVTLTNGDVKSQYATVTGKGDKERTIFFDQAAWAAVAEYMATKDGGPDDPLFMRHGWTRDKMSFLCTNSARRILTEMCHQASVKPTITPHQFRHRFATLLLRETGDLAKVQDLMGHESPETTRVYTVFNNDELRDAHSSTSL